MCIVFLHHDPKSKYPIRVGANREENIARPSTLPTVWDDLSILAGIDRGLKGEFATVGTWLTFSDKKGSFVAVTNRDDCKGKNKAKSRGVLCATLGLADLNYAIEFAIEELSKGGYGGCNLLLANLNEAYVIHGKEKPELIKLTPGTHVLTNLDIDDPNDERHIYVKERLALPNVMDLFETAARFICSDTNILVNDDDWGTVASSVLSIGKDTYEFWHCLGKPKGFADYKLYKENSDYFRKEIEKQKIVREP